MFIVNIYQHPLPRLCLNRQQKNHLFLAATFINNFSNETSYFRLYRLTFSVQYSYFRSDFLSFFLRYIRNEFAFELTLYKKCIYPNSYSHISIRKYISLYAFRVPQLFNCSIVVIRYMLLLQFVGARY